jgi:hypothetical protein
MLKSRCKKEGCESIRPCFKIEGETKGIYCSKHKEPNMVNVLEKGDVKKEYIVVNIKNLIFLML